MKSAQDPPSFQHFDLPGNVHLAINSNTKMKTILVSAAFVANLDDNVTKRALVPMILRRGTRRHRDMQSITRYLEGLYGALLVTYVQKVGEWHVTRYRVDVVNEKFLPGAKGILREAVEFLVEMFHDPLVAGRGFHEEYLEQEKKNLQLSIESLVDNKSAYAEERLVEAMCSSEPYRLYEYGRVEDIPAIRPDALLELEKDDVRRLPFHVYVAGDIDPEAAKGLFTAAFCGPQCPRSGGYRLKDLPAAVKPGPVREVVERMDVNQARLVLGFRHGITYADPAYETLLVMNGILGGYSHSKLFQNVREKANMAYSVHSGLERTKGLLFISAGIAPENYEKALRIILDQVKQLADGVISESEIRSTISTILNQNEMLEDNLGALGDVDFVWSLHARKLDLPAFREKLRQVSKDEIVAAARRLAHDTTYLLTSR